MSRTALRRVLAPFDLDNTMIAWLRPVRTCGPILDGSDLVQSLHLLQPTELVEHGAAAAQSYGRTDLAHGGGLARLCDVITDGGEDAALAAHVRI